MPRGVIAIKGKQKKIHIYSDMGELLGRNCEVGTSMKFLKNIGLFEDIKCLMERI